MDKRTTQFLKELKELQNKYEARVSYRMEGDTHGIYKDSLTVQFLEPLENGNRFRKWSDPIDIEEAE